MWRSFLSLLCGLIWWSLSENSVIRRCFACMNSCNQQHLNLKMMDHDVAFVRREKNSSCCTFSLHLSRFFCTAWLQNLTSLQTKLFHATLLIFAVVSCTRYWSRLRSSVLFKHILWMQSTSVIPTDVRVLKAVRKWTGQTTNWTGNPKESKWKDKRCLHKFWLTFRDMQ